MVTALRVEQAMARSRCGCLLRTSAGANRVIGATATSSSFASTCNRPFAPAQPLSRAGWPKLLVSGVVTGMRSGERSPASRGRLALAVSTR